MYTATTSGQHENQIFSKKRHVTAGKRRSPRIIL
jgi:hypothetical protein